MSCFGLCDHGWPGNRSGCIQHLLTHGIPSDAAKYIKQLPLASFSVDTTGRAIEPIRNFDGVRLDATSGQMTINAADSSGFQQVLRPKDIVTLNWYRRTAWRSYDAAR